MSFLSDLFGRKKPEPNPSSVLAFNYYYAFEYIPNIIQTFNQGLCPITRVFDIPRIITEHPEYSFFANKIEYGIANSRRCQSVKLFVIAIPNNGGLSQAHSAVIILDETKKYAQYFTLEISFDGKYAIVSPFVDKREAFGFISNPTEFTEKAVSIALANVASPINVKETVSSENKDKAEYLDRVEMLLEAGVEWFQNEFFPLSDAAKTECAIIIGSTILRCVKDEDIAYAILSNPDWSNAIEVSFIKSRLAAYQAEYDKRVATLDSPFRMRLVDFAKQYGRMKIAPMKNLDGTEYKIAAFIDSNDKITVASTASLTPQEVVPQYISEHRNDYGIRHTPMSQFELFSYSKEEANNLSFSALIANYLLINPLQFSDDFSSNDKVNNLGRAGYDVNIVLDKSISAYKSVRERVYMLGKELNLLPNEIPTLYDDLP